MQSTPNSQGTPRNLPNLPPSSTPHFCHQMKCWHPEYCLVRQLCNYLSLLPLFFSVLQCALFVSRTGEKRCNQLTGRNGVSPRISSWGGAGCSYSVTGPAFQSLLTGLKPQLHSPCLSLSLFPHPLPFLLLPSDTESPMGRDKLTPGVKPAGMRLDGRASVGNASGQLPGWKGGPEESKGGVESLGKRQKEKRQKETHQKYVQRKKKIRQRGREINNPTSRFSRSY